MNITVIAAALTIASIQEFVDSYRVNAERDGQNLKLTDRNGVSILLPLADSKNISAGEVRLKTLFEFLDSENTDSVIADWEMHCHREAAMENIEPVFASPLDDEQDFEFGSREREIIEVNETLVAPPSEIFVSIN